MSQRTERVESIVRAAVATELVELLGQDAARLTVTGVDVSPDLRHALVWLGVFGNESLQESLLKRVCGAAGDLQRVVARQLTTKFVPRLEFRLDTGGAYAAEIGRLLKRP